MPQPTPPAAPLPAPADPALPGVSRRVLVADKTFPRYSEGDVLELSDGRLLLAVTRKGGAGDFAAGTVIGLFSRDGGLSWDDAPHVIRAPWGDVVDVMSVSLCRTPRGLHLFFLGRGKNAQSDTRVYQLLSVDDGKTWGEPILVSTRGGYHVVNNARVLRTAAGRLIVPSAWVAGPIGKQFNAQRVFCYLSDDDGRSWRTSNDLVLDGKPLMEPGVAECADGSIYMTIRTALGHLYEARSRDGGATWADFRATDLPAPAAPSTVVRAPGGDALWMLWCDNARGNWKGRTRIVFADSKDHGRTWSAPRFVESDPRGSFGYTSVTPVGGDHVLLTYYDWRDRGQPPFDGTSLRSRLIPRAWFDGQPTPPVFRTAPDPVLRQDNADGGKIVSTNAGLLTDGDRWRLWYTHGALGPKGEHLRVEYAGSRDAGRTWTKTADADNGVLPLKGDTASVYHPCVHREGDRLVLFAWRNAGGGDSALYRYVSADDGKTFVRSPERPLIAAWSAKPAVKAAAGEGRACNDAYHVLRNDDDGTYELFAACIEPAAEERQVFKHDNAAGKVRVIGHATSKNGIDWSPLKVVLEPDLAHGDPPDTQFYGLHVFRHRGFYLGLLHTFHADAQVIQPEWAWSHNGVNWTRTKIPCIPLGDEGRFDSRMICFGQPVLTADELIWLYAGSDWRHNAFKAGEVATSIGRATLPRPELESWLDALPKP
jgi:hypothetical protein